MVEIALQGPVAQKAVEAVCRLRSAGHVALLAGGCVRDLLIGREPKDYDIATDARPDNVQALFPGSIPVGVQFGVVRVPVRKHFFDVSTFRADHSYHDGRHPVRVTFSDPESDARRRDFTVNAMFLDPVTSELHDFVGGREDISRRVIRSVGDPHARFGEDYLRMMRAARFAATLEFSLDPETRMAVIENAPHITAVSPERIMEELTRILTGSAAAGQAILLLLAMGLLRPILPEVADMEGQEQPPRFHPEGDVLRHTVQMLDSMPRPRTDALAFAVLLHDVGKPPTASTAADRIRFDGHASHGADLASAILKRLRAPSHLVSTVEFAIRHHMQFIDVQRMKRSTLRRLLGRDTFPMELKLHRLDCKASHGSLDNYEFLLAARKEFEDEPVLPKPWISGHDIMSMGVPEGPTVGKWHRAAHDAQLEGRFADHEQLLAWLEGEIGSRS